MDVFPPDVRLSLLQHCDLEDGLSLCLTSKSWSTLLDEATFWLYALQRRKKEMSISSANHNDLSNRSLRELKEIALRSLRLTRNWNAPNPQVAGPVMVCELPIPKMDNVFFVPGMPLYALHSPENGMLTCWNSHTRETMGPSIAIGQRIMDLSPGMDAPGSFTMGLLAGRIVGFLTYWLRCVVVELQYGADPGVGASLTMSFEKGLMEETVWAWGVFRVGEAVIGVLSSRVDSDVVWIQVFDTKTGYEVLLETDIPMKTANLAGTTTVGEDLFIIAEEVGASSVYKVRGDFLRNTSHDGTRRHERLNLLSQCTVHPLAEEARAAKAMCTLTSTAEYGNPALSIHSMDIETGTLEEPVVDPGMYVRFWRVVGDDGASIAPQRGARISGKRASPEHGHWWLMLLAHSGHYMTMLMREGASERLKLQMVRYHDGGLTCHVLEVPEEIDLSRVWNLTLDDQRGVVTVFGNEKYMYEIPYC